MFFQKAAFFAVISVFNFSLQAREPLYSFKGDEKVLDLCCGEGDLSLSIAKVVRKGAVCGVDFSKSVIEEAKKKHLRAPSHLSFKHKDLKDLHFSDLFDVVTTLSLNSALYHPRDLLKKIHDLLKPSGMVDIAFVKKIPTAVQSALKACITDEKWAEYFLTYYPKAPVMEEADLKVLFEKQKFKTLEFKAVSDDELFSSTEAFQTFIKKWLPYVAILPEAKQQDFLDFFTEKYLRIFPRDKQGQIHFLVEKYEFLAQKT